MSQKITFRPSLFTLPSCHARRLMLAAAISALTTFCGGNLNAQTTVGYLQQIAPKGKAMTGGTIPQIPASSTLAPGFCDPKNPGQPLCFYGPFRLPGYGSSVYITFSGDVPPFSWGHNKSAEIRSTSNGAYRWGTDTDSLSLGGTNPHENFYKINFYFDGVNAPSPADLVLVVAGLKDGSTAAVTGVDSSGAPAKLSLKNGGEYTFPANSTWWCWPTCKSSAPTVFPGTSGTPTFSSGYQTSNNTDSRNTGWDIYQPNVNNLRVLSLDVDQVPGDGLAFTLGYRQCVPLIGNSLDSRDGRVRHLYDINTATGAATNSVQIGANWGLAFTPLSPAGTLYALAQNGGTPVGNSLFTVDRTTGAATLVPTTPALGTLNRGGLAADPTTGILYGVDGDGNLFSINNGAVAQIGKVTGTYYSGYQVLAALAFDGSGNLFIVEASSYRLLKISAPVNPASVAKAGAVLLSPHKANGFAALAIDPWSGSSFYAEAGLLYSLNLTNGSLTLIAPVTGAEDFGYLASLTFQVGIMPGGNGPSRVLTDGLILQLQADIPEKPVLTALAFPAYGRGRIFASALKDRNVTGSSTSLNLVQYSRLPLSRYTESIRPDYPAENS